MEKIKKFFSYIFRNEILLKILIVFAIITLAKGEFVIYHKGYIDIGNGFDLNVKLEK